MDNEDFNQLINQILTNVKISAVISASIKTIQKGNTTVALCPFHNDHHPSLNISDQKKIFKCFSCGVGGNSITFVQKFYRVGFISAVERINRTFGLKIALVEKLKKQKSAKLSPLQAKIANINRHAKNFYNYVLITELEENTAIKNYCRERNLTLPIIQEFNLGYAPENSSKLLNFCDEQNLDYDDCVVAGILAVAGSEYKTFFIKRIIFPIFDENNDVVGFSGRSIENNTKKPKYINTKSNLLFQKKSLLYNINKVKNNYQCKSIILTEGFMDVIALFRSGFPNSVAAIGVSVSKVQIMTLMKYNQELILAFNNDRAGLKSTINTIALCLEQNSEPKVINFYQDNDHYVNDIDELYKISHAQGVKKIVDNSVHFFTFFTNLYHSDFQQVSRKLAFSRKVMRVLTSFPTVNNVISEGYLAEWAKLNNISIEAIYTYLNHKHKPQQRREIATINYKTREFNYLNVLTQLEKNVLVDFVRRWDVEEIYYWFALENQEYNNMLVATFQFLRKYQNDNSNFQEMFQWKSPEYIQLLEENSTEQKFKLDKRIIDLFKAILTVNNRKQTDLTTRFWRRKHNYLVDKRNQWVATFDNEFRNILSNIDCTNLQNHDYLQNILGNKNSITSFAITKLKVPKTAK